MSKMEYLPNLVLLLPVALAVAGVLFRVRGAVLWLASLVMALLIFLILGAGSVWEFMVPMAAREGIQWGKISFSLFWGQEFAFRSDLFSFSQGFFVAWVFLASLVVDRAGWFEHRSKLCALLLLMFGILGSVFAANLLTFAAFSLLSVFPGTMLVGWDGAVSGEQAVKFGVAGMMGGVFLVITYLGLHPAVMPEDARTVGSFGLRDGLFWLFAVTLLARMPVVPFHAAQWVVLRLKHLSALLPLALTWNIGLYGLFRFGPELFPEQIVRFSGALAALGGASLAASALFVFKSRESRLFVHGVQVFLVSTALIGFASLNRLGWMGSWMVSWIGTPVLCVSFLLLLAWERRRKNFLLSDLSSAPFYGGSAVYAAMALAGLPVSLLFFALLFSFVGASQAFQFMFVVVAVAMPLVLAAVVKRLFFSHANEDAASGAAGAFLDLNRGERFAIFPLIVFLVVSVFLINPISHRMSEAVTASLQVSGWGGE